MLFNSIDFVLFFPAVTLLFFALPHRFKWVLLLTASCVFYMWFVPEYILILALTIGVDYWAAMKIERSEGRRRKSWLIISVVTTCLILFFFKYFNFFNTNLREIAAFLNWNYPVDALKVILPIGLSFHTFQSLSYVIEVYRGGQKAVRHLGIYSLYVMFYPQLVAGPIERPQNLVPQLQKQHYFNYGRVTDGLRQMMWGFFKKVVVADNLALMVNNVYNAPTEYHGFPILLASVFFAFQIYCDFSGYSDIAIGSARVMGFDLMKNFDRPYYSRTIKEFWTRWHISLSTWFRDYVYIPLGGNRVIKWRWYYNLFITFLISGLWHGAAWTFIIWGAMHACYLIFALATDKWRSRMAFKLGFDKVPAIRYFLNVLVVFLLVDFAWIFFRAPSLSHAATLIHNLFSGNILADIRLILTDPAARAKLLFLNQPGRIFYTAIAGICIVELVHILQKDMSVSEYLSKLVLPVRWSIYLLFVLAIMNLGVPSDIPFIYFQF